MATVGDREIGIMQSKRRQNSKIRFNTQSGIKRCFKIMTYWYRIFPQKLHFSAHLIHWFLVDLYKGTCFCFSHIMELVLFCFIFTWTSIPSRVLYLLQKLQTYTAPNASSSTSRRHNCTVNIKHGSQPRIKCWHSCFPSWYSFPTCRTGT